MMNNAIANAQTLKNNGATIVTLGIGNENFSTLGQLATNNSFNFAISDLTDNNAVTSMVNTIAEKLASVCAVNGTPTTTTKYQTTTSTSPPTTPPSTIPPTTALHCTKGPFINQDIAIVYDLSTANASVPNLADSLTSMIGNQFFADPAYNIDANITRLALAPFPVNDNILGYINGITFDYNIIPNRLNLQRFANLTLMLYESFGDLNLLTAEGLNNSLTTVNSLNTTLQNTVILFATESNGVTNADQIVQTLKSKGTTIIVIFVGNGNSTGFESIASDASLFKLLPNATDTATVKTIAEFVKTYLLQKSPICGF
uniref:VWFA domain-containing protein n=1 Tax=Panagrolaimus superbus TaxID=310955 RepID=A0A914XXS0_9BILA